jgi:hypothetical protein
MNKSETITKLALALSKAQAELPAVKFDAQNPFLKNKYATLGAVIETARPILAKHELAVVQSPVSRDGQIGVTTLITHSSGEWLEDTIFIAATDSKGLSSAQNAGVVISYLRRYSLQAFLSMYADEDTDGQKSEPARMEKPQPTKQVPNEIITAAEWDNFMELANKAKAAGVNVPEYDRSKMNPKTVNGAKAYLNQELSKKEAK